MFDYKEMQDQIRGSIENNLKNQIGTGEGIDKEKVITSVNLYYYIVTYLLWGLGIITVIVLIYAGIQYITAGGDAEKAEKAKKTILGAVIGLIIIIASYAIYNFTLEVGV